MSTRPTGSNQGTSQGAGSMICLAASTQGYIPATPPWKTHTQAKKVRRKQQGRGLAFKKNTGRGDGEVTWRGGSGDALTAGGATVSM